MPGFFISSGVDRITPSTSEIATMAKPNYSFEKRQRELAKKKKQDEKQAKKQAARDSANPASAKGD